MMVDLGQLESKGFKNGYKGRDILSTGAFLFINVLSSVWTSSNIRLAAKTRGEFFE